MMVTREPPEIAIRTAHNREAHLWGIQRGLELIERDGSVYLEAGSAVDADGRLIVLEARVRLDLPRAFLLHDVDRLEVTIGRGDGVVQVEVRPSLGSLTAVPVAQPVVLGTVHLVGGVDDPTYVLDVTHRRYAGVRANRLVTDGGTVAGSQVAETWLEIDRSGSSPTVEFLPDPVLPDSGVRLGVDGMDIPGELSVDGDLTVRGPIQFEAVSQGPSIQDGEAALFVVNDAIRLHTGGLPVEIGSFSPTTSSFAPVVTVDQGHVTVEGDVTVGGRVESATKNQRELTERARTYIAVMNQVGAVGGQIGDKDTFVAVAEFLVELAVQNSANEWLVELLEIALDGIQSQIEFKVAVDGLIDVATRTPPDEWLDELIIDAVRRVTRKTTFGKVSTELARLGFANPRWLDVILKPLFDGIPNASVFESVAEQLFRRIGDKTTLAAVGKRLRAREYELELNNIVCP